MNPFKEDKKMRYPTKKIVKSLLARLQTASALTKLKFADPLAFPRWWRLFPRDYSHESVIWRATRAQSLQTIVNIARESTAKTEEDKAANIDTSHSELMHIYQLAIAKIAAALPDEYEVIEPTYDGYEIPSEYLIAVYQTAKLVAKETWQSSLDKTWRGVSQIDPRRAAVEVYKETMTELHILTGGRRWLATTRGSGSSAGD